MSLQLVMQETEREPFLIGDYPENIRRYPTMNGRGPAMNRSPSRLNYFSSISLSMTHRVTVEFHRGCLARNSPTVLLASKSRYRFHLAVPSRRGFSLPAASTTILLSGLNSGRFMPSLLVATFMFFTTLATLATLAAAVAFALAFASALSAFSTPVFLAIFGLLCWVQPNVAP